jgi:SAM-dependent methyltransferase
LTFAAGEARWRARLGTLRQVVRQELVTRQLAAHLPADGRVLDVGCGQGTQLLRLARRGYDATGVDSSPTLLADLGRAASDTRVRTILGEAPLALDALADNGFDVVLCHGVLMYLDDPGPLLDALVRVVAPGGLASLLVRNGDALAMRPGLAGDWATARAAFDGTGYDNRIGVRARADRLADLTTALEARGLTVRAWYGVRVLTDALPADTAVPGAAELDELLACEERAGATDPYRRVAALTHLVLSA